MKKIFAFCICILCVYMVIGQSFLEPSFSFSRKQVSYVTLKKGLTVEVYLTSIKRRKGLIESVKFKTVRGKKYRIKASDIKHMYLMPSSFDQLNSKVEYLIDIKHWDENALNKDYIGKGYVYFEQAPVQLSKTKERVLLMQLLNPSFSHGIKVYPDPYSNASIEVDDYSKTSGIANSYYFRKGGENAIKVSKKNFLPEFQYLFGDCEATSTFQNMEWKHLDKLTHTHNEHCN